MLLALLVVLAIDPESTCGVKLGLAGREYAACVSRMRSADGEAERQRAEAERARRDIEARVAANPKAQPVLLSATICAQRERILAANAGIEHEKRKKKITGVTNNIALNMAGEIIVAAEDAIDKLTKKLAPLKPLPCDTVEMKAVAFCLNHSAEECAAAGHKEAVDAVYDRLVAL